MARRSRSFRLAGLAWVLMCSLLVAVATPALAGGAAQVTEGAVSSSGERTLAGDTRYSTAVVLAQRATERGAGAGGVVVVSGESLVDALSAVPLAAAWSSVVVLTQTGSLPDVVADFVRTHGAGGVTVVGGTAAVSKGVADQLGELAGLREIDRFAGADRYETAVAVARAAGTPGSWCGEAGPAVLMVNGNSLIDGVLAAPVAYAMGLGVLFSRADALPDVVRDYLTDVGVGRAVLIGSKAELTDGVANELSGLGVAVTRIDGATPAERSVALADAAAGCGAATDVFALLDATVPVDGVAAAALLATGVARTASGQPRPLVPVLAVGRDLPAVIAKHLSALGDVTDEVTLYALGGTARITPQLMRDALDAAEGSSSDSENRRSSSGSSNRGTSRGERSSSGSDTSSGVTATTNASKTAVTTSVGDSTSATRGPSATRTAASPLRASPIGIEVTPTTEPPTTTAPPTTTVPQPPATTQPPQGPEVDVPDNGPPDSGPPTTNPPVPEPTTTQPPSTTQPPAPQPPAPEAPAVSEFVSVSAGRTHSCGLTADGTVECWGYLWGGSAPDGTFTEITSGSWHSCGIRPEGSVVCWGDNPFGQLDAPAYEFTTISAGRQHTCGVRTNGKVACWGELPRGTPPPKKGTFIAVDAGYQHTCAVRTSGEIACWGNNDYAQLNAPAGSFTAVTTGNIHTCALRADGQIACWGHPRDGRTNPPTGTFIAVAAGYDHACALADNGAVTCWGRNRYSVLDSPAGAHTDVAAGAYHNCALAANGAVTCWGSNDFGQLGAYAARNSTTITTEPPANPTLPPGEDVPVELEDDPAVDAPGDDEPAEDEPAEEDQAAAIDTAS